MNVFISGPALTSSKNLLSVWDWGGGRTPLFLFYFCFEDFKLRIKNETQNIAINHNLWSWPFFFCGRTDFIFSNSKKMVYGIYYLLSYTWQSVGFLFHVIHNGCFLAHALLSSRWTTAHWGSWTFTSCVCLWTQAGHCHCLCRAEATVSFQACSPWVLPCCWHKRKKTITQQKHAHNPHLAPLNSSILLLTIVTFLVLNHSPLLPSPLHDI